MVFQDINVSIIVPVYNVEEYLADCLNSLIMQTLENIEIICIDDKSSDNSYKILEYFSKKDNRIKVFQNKKNIGLGASRNVGLSKSSGKYVCFLDSDDWLDRDTLKNCFDNAEEYNLDILMFKLINYDEDRKKFFKTSYYSMDHMDKYIDKILTVNDLFNSEIFRLPNSACNKLYKKSFLIENNITFPEGLIHEDNPFYFETILNSNKFIILDKYYYNRRIRSNSITQKSDKSLMNVMEITNIVFDFFIKSGLFNKYKRNVLKYMMSLLKNKYYLIDDTFKPEYYKRLQEKMKIYLNLYDLEKDFLENLNYHDKKFFQLILTSKDYDELQDNVLKLKKRNEKFNVSIIIPVYNAKRVEIHNAFKSIKNQTMNFDDIEVIFVDDCSQFQEGTIYIKELNDLYPNVKSIFLDENKGSGNARNIGIKNATSNYIMFLDHDDHYLKKACQTLYETIKESDADMVCGNYINLGRGKNPINWKSINNNKYKTEVKSVLDNPNIFRIDPSIWSKIFKKEFLKTSNTYFQDFKSGQDLVFFQESLFKANNIVLINEPIVVYEYRKSDNMELQSMSLNNSKKILIVLIDVYEYSYELFKKYDESLIDYPLNLLNYWVNSRLLNSNLNYNELREVVDKASFLFKKFYDRNKNKKFNHENLFKAISEKNYICAYELYSQLKMS